MNLASIKFILIFLLLSLNKIQLCASDVYNIVYVHMGKELPTYSIDSVKQARLFNPECNIYFLVEDSLTTYLKSQLNADNIFVISIETLNQSPEHSFFKKKFPQKQQFWIYTTERFFVLQELIKQKKLKKVFHLENDVMLYCNLEEMLPIYEKFYSGKMGLTLDFDDRCIPGFVYIDELKPLDQLINFIYSKKYSKNENDMKLLASFQKHHSDYVLTLPIITSNYSNKFVLKNEKNKRVRKNNIYYQCFDEFKSIFDAAALGQYLGGTHVEKKPGFINETCCFNPSLLKFSWEKDDQGRWVPYMILDGEKTKINNLHIHSKQLFKFYSLNPKCGKF